MMWHKAKTNESKNKDTLKEIIMQKNHFASYHKHNCQLIFPFYEISLKEVVKTAASLTFYW